MRRWLLVVAILAPAFAFAQRNAEDRKWNAPVAPFRIVANLYYVGAAEVASYLITTPKGHIIIDGGFEETAPMILANVHKLGFDPHDVRILLNTHAHYDHAGGLLELKNATQATFMASEPDAPLLAAGGRGDAQFANRFGFPAIIPDRLLRDGDKVSLGGATLTAHVTSGHTPGCTTWTTTIRQRLKPYDVVIVCSASVPDGYNLVGNAHYPNIVADYRRTFATLRSLPCDIPLAPHGSFFNLMEKAKLARSDGPNAFVDQRGYKAYVDRAEAAFERALKKETDAQAAH